MDELFHSLEQIRPRSVILGKYVRLLKDQIGEVRRRLDNPTDTQHNRENPQNANLNKTSLMQDGDAYEADCDTDGPLDLNQNGASQLEDGVLADILKQMDILEQRLEYNLDTISPELYLGRMGLSEQEGSTQNTLSKLDKHLAKPEPERDRNNAAALTMRLVQDLRSDISDLCSRAQEVGMYQGEMIMVEDLHQVFHMLRRIIDLLTPKDLELAHMEGANQADSPLESEQSFTTAISVSEDKRRERRHRNRDRKTHRHHQDPMSMQASMPPQDADHRPPDAAPDSLSARDDNSVLAPRGHAKQQPLPVITEIQQGSADDRSSSLGQGEDRRSKAGWRTEQDRASQRRGSHHSSRSGSTLGQQGAVDPPTLPPSAAESGVEAGGMRGEAGAWEEGSERSKMEGGLPQSDSRRAWWGSTLSQDSVRVPETVPEERGETELREAPSSDSLHLCARHRALLFRPRRRSHSPKQTRKRTKSKERRHTGSHSRSQSETCAAVREGRYWLQLHLTTLPLTSSDDPSEQEEEKPPMRRRRTRSFGVMLTAADRARMVETLTSPDFPDRCAPSTQSQRPTDPIACPLHSAREISARESEPTTSQGVAALQKKSASVDMIVSRQASESSHDRNSSRSRRHSRRHVREHVQAEAKKVTASDAQLSTERRSLQRLDSAKELEAPPPSDATISPISAARKSSKISRKSSRQSHSKQSSAEASQPALRSQDSSSLHRQALTYSLTDSRVEAPRSKQMPSSEDTMNHAQSISDQLRLQRQEQFKGDAEQDLSLSNIRSVSENQCLAIRQSEAGVMRTRESVSIAAEAASQSGRLPRRAAYDAEPSVASSLGAQQQLSFGHEEAIIDRHNIPYREPLYRGSASSFRNISQAEASSSHSAAPKGLPSYGAIESVSQNQGVPRRPSFSPMNTESQARQVECLQEYPQYVSQARQEGRPSPQQSQGTAGSQCRGHGLGAQSAQPTPTRGSQSHMTYQQPAGVPMGEQSSAAALSQQTNNVYPYQDFLSHSMGHGPSGSIAAGLTSQISMASPDQVLSSSFPDFYGPHVMYPIKQMMGPVCSTPVGPDESMRTYFGEAAPTPIARTQEAALSSPQASKRDDGMITEVGAGRKPSTVRAKVVQDPRDAGHGDEPASSTITSQQVGLFRDARQKTATVHTQTPSRNEVPSEEESQTQEVESPSLGDAGSVVTRQKEGEAQRAKVNMAASRFQGHAEQAPLPSKSTSQTRGTQAPQLSPARMDTKMTKPMDEKDIRLPTYRAAHPKLDNLDTEGLYLHLDEVSSSTVETQTAISSQGSSSLQQPSLSRDSQGSKVIGADGWKPQRKDASTWSSTEKDAPSAGVQEDGLQTSTEKSLSQSTIGTQWTPRDIIADTVSHPLRVFEEGAQSATAGRLTKESRDKAGSCQVLLKSVASQCDGTTGRGDLTTDLAAADDSEARAQAAAAVGKAKPETLHHTGSTQSAVKAAKSAPDETHVAGKLGAGKEAGTRSPRSLSLPLLTCCATQTSPRPGQRERDVMERASQTLASSPARPAVQETMPRDVVKVTVDYCQEGHLDHLDKEDDTFSPPAAVAAMPALDGDRSRSCRHFATQADEGSLAALSPSQSRFVQRITVETSSQGPGPSPQLSPRPAAHRSAPTIFSTTIRSCQSPMRTQSCESRYSDSLWQSSSSSPYHTASLQQSLMARGGVDRGTQCEPPDNLGGQFLARHGDAAHNVEVQYHHRLYDDRQASRPRTGSVDPRPSYARTECPHVFRELSRPSATPTSRPLPVRSDVTSRLPAARSPEANLVTPPRQNHGSPKRRSAAHDSSASPQPPVRGSRDGGSREGYQSVAPRGVDDGFRGGRGGDIGGGGGGRYTLPSDRCSFANYYIPRDEDADERLGGASGGSCHRRDRGLRATFPPAHPSQLHDELNASFEIAYVPEMDNISRVSYQSDRPRVPDGVSRATYPQRGASSAVDAPRAKQRAHSHRDRAGDSGARVIHSSHGGHRLNISIRADEVSPPPRRHEDATSTAKGQRQRPHFEDSAPKVSRRSQHGRRHEDRAAVRSDERDLRGRPPPSEEVTSPRSRRSGRFEEHDDAGSRGSYQGRPRRDEDVASRVSHHSRRIKNEDAVSQVSHYSGANADAASRYSYPSDNLLDFDSVSAVGHPIDYRSPRGSVHASRTSHRRDSYPRVETVAQGSQHSKPGGDGSPRAGRPHRGAASAPPATSNQETEWRQAEAESPRQSPRRGHRQTTHEDAEHMGSPHEGRGHVRSSKLRPGAGVSRGDSSPGIYRLDLSHEQVARASKPGMNEDRCNTPHAGSGGARIGRDSRSTFRSDDGYNKTEDGGRYQRNSEGTALKQKGSGNREECPHAFDAFSKPVADVGESHSVGSDDMDNRSEEGGYVPAGTLQKVESIGGGDGDDFGNVLQDGEMLEEDTRTCERTFSDGSCRDWHYPCLATRNLEELSASPSLADSSVSQQSGHQQEEDGARTSFSGEGVDTDLSPKLLLPRSLSRISEGRHSLSSAPTPQPPTPQPPDMEQEGDLSPTSSESQMATAVSVNTSSGRHALEVSNSRSSRTSPPRETLMHRHGTSRQGSRDSQAVSLTPTSSSVGQRKDLIQARSHTSSVASSRVSAHASRMAPAGGSPPLPADVREGGSPKASRKALSEVREMPSGRETPGSPRTKSRASSMVESPVSRTKTRSKTSSSASPTHGKSGASFDTHTATSFASSVVTPHTHHVPSRGTSQATHLSSNRSGSGVETSISTKARSPKTGKVHRHGSKATTGQSDYVPYCFLSSTSHLSGVSQGTGLSVTRPRQTSDTTAPAPGETSLITGHSSGAAEAYSSHEVLSYPQTSDSSGLMTPDPAAAAAGSAAEVRADLSAERGGDVEHPLCQHRRHSAMPRSSGCLRHASLNQRQPQHHQLQDYRHQQQESQQQSALHHHLQQSQHSVQSSHQHHQRSGQTQAQARPSPRAGQDYNTRKVFGPEASMELSAGGFAPTLTGMDKSQSDLRRSRADALDEEALDLSTEGFSVRSQGVPAPALRERRGSRSYQGSGQPSPELSAHRDTVSTDSRTSSHVAPHRLSPSRNEREAGRDDPDMSDSGGEQVQVFCSGTCISADSVPLPPSPVPRCESPTREDVLRVRKLAKAASSSLPSRPSHHASPDSSLASHRIRESGSSQEASYPRGGDSSPRLAQRCPCSPPAPHSRSPSYPSRVTSPTPSHRSQGRPGVVSKVDRTSALSLHSSRSPARLSQYGGSQHSPRRETGLGYPGPGCRHDSTPEHFCAMHVPGGRRPLVEGSAARRHLPPGDRSRHSAATFPGLDPEQRTDQAPDHSSCEDETGSSESSTASSSLEKVTLVASIIGDASVVGHSLPPGAQWTHGQSPQDWHDGRSQRPSQASTTNFMKFHPREVNVARRDSALSFPDRPFRPYPILSVAASVELQQPREGEVPQRRSPHRSQARRRHLQDTSFSNNALQPQAAEYPPPSTRDSAMESQDIPASGALSDDMAEDHVKTAGHNALAHADRSTNAAGNDVSLDNIICMGISLPLTLPRHQGNEVQVEALPTPDTGSLASGEVHSDPERRPPLLPGGRGEILERWGQQQTAMTNFLTEDCDVAAALQESRRRRAEVHQRYREMGNNNNNNDDCQVLCPSGSSNEGASGDSRSEAEEEVSCSGSDVPCHDGNYSLNNQEGYGAASSEECSPPKGDEDNYDHCYGYACRCQPESAPRQRSWSVQDSVYASGAGGFGDSICHSLGSETRSISAPPPLKSCLKRDDRDGASDGEGEERLQPQSSDRQETAELNRSRVIPNRVRWKLKPRSSDSGSCLRTMSDSEDFDAYLDETVYEDSQEYDTQGVEFRPRPSRIFQHSPGCRRACQGVNNNAGCPNAKPAVSPEESSRLQTPTGHRYDERDDRTGRAGQAGIDLYVEENACATRNVSQNQSQNGSPEGEHHRSRHGSKDLKTYSSDSPSYQGRRLQEEDTSLPSQQKQRCAGDFPAGDQPSRENYTNSARLESSTWLGINGMRETGKGEQVYAEGNYNSASNLKIPRSGDSQADTLRDPRKQGGRGSQQRPRELHVGDNFSVTEPTQIQSGSTFRSPLGDGDLSIMQRSPHRHYMEGQHHGGQERRSDLHLSDSLRSRSHSKHPSMGTIHKRKTKGSKDKSPKGNAVISFSKMGSGSDSRVAYKGEADHPEGRKGGSGAGPRREAPSQEDTSQRPSSSRQQSCSMLSNDYLRERNLKIQMELSNLKRYIHNLKNSDSYAKATSSGHQSLFEPESTVGKAAGSHLSADKDRDYLVDNMSLSTSLRGDSLCRDSDSRIRGDSTSQLGKSSERPRSRTVDMDYRDFRKPLDTLRRVVADNEKRLESESTSNQRTQPSQMSGHRDQTTPEKRSVVWPRSTERAAGDQTEGSRLSSQGGAVQNLKARVERHDGTRSSDRRQTLERPRPQSGSFSRPSFADRAKESSKPLTDNVPPRDSRHGSKEKDCGASLTSGVDSRQSSRLGLTPQRADRRNSRISPLCRSVPEESGRDGTFAGDGRFNVTQEGAGDNGMAALGTVNVSDASRPDGRLTLECAWRQGVSEISGKTLDSRAATTVNSERAPLRSVIMEEEALDLLHSKTDVESHKRWPTQAREEVNRFDGWNAHYYDFRSCVEASESFESGTCDWGPAQTEPVAKVKKMCCVKDCYDTACSSESAMSLEKVGVVDSKAMNTSSFSEFTHERKEDATYQELNRDRGVSMYRTAIKEEDGQHLKAPRTRDNLSPAQRFARIEPRQGMRAAGSRRRDLPLKMSRRIDANQAASGPRKRIPSDEDAALGEGAAVAGEDSQSSLSGDEPRCDYVGCYDDAATISTEEVLAHFHDEEDGCLDCKAQGELLADALKSPLPCPPLVAASQSFSGRPSHASSSAAATLASLSEAAVAALSAKTSYVTAYVSKGAAKCSQSLRRFPRLSRVLPALVVVVGVMVAVYLYWNPEWEWQRHVPSWQELYALVRPLELYRLRSPPT